MRAFWREILSQFPEADFEVEEIVDAGDRVLAVIQANWVARTFGPVGGRHYAVWTLRDAKVILQVFTERAPAEREVRLAAETDEQE